VNLEWNEICLKEAFAYQRESVDIEYKISKFRDRKKLVDAENIAITGDFDPI